MYSAKLLEQGLDAEDTQPGGISTAPGAEPDAAGGAAAAVVLGAMLQLPVGCHACGCQAGRLPNASSSGSRLDQAASSNLSRAWAVQGQGCQRTRHTNMRSLLIAYVQVVLDALE